MVQIAGKGAALQQLGRGVGRLVGLGVAGFVGLAVVYGSCTARVNTHEYGIEQRRFGAKTGVEEKVYSPGLYFLGPGVTLHTFPREVHVLEASNDWEDARAKARTPEVAARVESYFKQRDEMLGQSTHRTVDALTVQTSDGYQVIVDVTLLYSISDPVKLAKEFGWGSLYVDSFVINTFRSSCLATLGKMNAEAFYDEKLRIAALKDAEQLLKEKFAARGFKVEKLLIGHYRYAANYEKSLHDKKVAVQLAEKNRKEGLVNDERAKLQSIESKGDAAITIAESEVNRDIAKVRAEAELYASQKRAEADKAVGLAEAEGKRLKADALNTSGGRYVVALETAKMFDAVQSAVMTPEQYIAFIRQSWALVGLSAGGPVPTATASKE